MRYLSLLVGTLVAAILAAVGAVTPAATGAATGSYIYGIDDSNRIWEADPVTKALSMVNDTGLAGSTVSNSLAYDTGRDQFFFMYSGSTAAFQNSLVFWDRTGTGLSSLRKVATFAEMGIAGDPANASFYANSYWFMGSGNSTLTQIKLTYGADDKPNGITKITHNLATYAAPRYPGGLNWGDIAITGAGQLYGVSTSGAFFALDLTKLGDTSQSLYTSIASGVGSRQISFNPDFSVLYAQNYDDGKWSTLDLANGTQTPVDFITLPQNNKGFRDLGGAADTRAAQLTLTKTADRQDFSAVGQVLTYTLTATNSGALNLNSVTVSDPMLADLSCTPAIPATLGPGAAITCTGTHTVTQADLDAGKVENTATASAKDPGGADVVADATLLVPGTRTPALELTKRATPAEIEEKGDQIKYVLVALVGNVTLTGVTISDPSLDGDLTCTPEVPATVAPDARVRCVGTYRATAADIEAGRIVNTATATGTDPDGNVVRAIDRAVVRVKTPLTVVARDEGDRLVPGNRVLLVESSTPGDGVVVARSECLVKGHRVRGQRADTFCGSRVVRKSGTVRVSAKPTCTSGVKIRVRTAAKTKGRARNSWVGTWKVARKPRIVCTLHGTG